MAVMMVAKLAVEKVVDSVACWDFGKVAMSAAWMAVSMVVETAVKKVEKTAGEKAALRVG